jgi:hypothetical protein
MRSSEVYFLSHAYVQSVELRGAGFCCVAASWHRVVIARALANQKKERHGALFVTGPKPNLFSFKPELERSLQQPLVQLFSRVLRV